MRGRRVRARGPAATATATLWAFLKVNRLPTLFGYNLAYFLVGVGLAGATGRLELLVPYGVAVLLAKMSASVADAIHDREVDADNPSKSSVARAVDTLGRERAWSVLAVEMVAAMALFGLVSTVTGDPLFVAVGAALSALGFLYSYPPRFKERGVANHVVTTAADVGTSVLAVPYLLVGRVGPETWLAVAAVFLYTFGYHLVHQAADAYHDRDSGVDTFALSVGADRTVAYAAALTGVAAGFAVALGYPAAALVLAGATVQYLSLYRRVYGESLRRQTELLTDRFSVASTATVLNAAMAVGVLGRALAAVPMPLRVPVP